MAREAIALMLKVDPATIAVEVRPELPDVVSHALEARRAARQAEEAAERATAAAVQSLLDGGYTVRDAGALLRLSPQRISQIAPRERASAKAVAATRAARPMVRERVE